MVIVVIVVTLIMLFALNVLRRNDLVFRERMRLIDLIYTLNISETAALVDNFTECRILCNERYALLDSIKYNEMIYKFWIPVKKFYADVDWKKW